MRLSVFGVGYVGLITGACFADRGHSVVAVDKDPDVIARLRRGVPGFYEPGLEEMLARNLEASRLTFTTDPEEAVKQSEVVFLCVGTPPRSDGSSDLEQVEEVARSLAPLLHGYRLIVRKSTVPVNPGRLIERTLRLFALATASYEVASNPEFLREGSAIHDFLHPDRIVIGADSDRARALLLELYGRDFDCPNVVTDVKTAELIKHASNAFLASKISFINMVSNLCEELGIDVTTVARGLGLDHRIGGHFLNAGLGFGGSCLPKDLTAFAKIAEDHGVDFSLLRAVEQINEERAGRLLRKIDQALWVVRGKTIGVLGVAFKPETSDIRNAPSLRIITQLKKAGAVLRVYDPQGAQNLQRLYPPDPTLAYAASPYEAAADAHALVILTEWDEFRSVDLGRIRAIMRTPIIVDGRNLFGPDEMLRKGFEYHSLGRGDIDRGAAPLQPLVKPRVASPAAGRG